MEKKDLLEYLKAVCGAEEAAYACEETIRALQNELQNEQRRIEQFVKPDRPKKEEPSLVEPYQEQFKMSVKESSDSVASVGVFSIVFGTIFTALGISGYLMSGGKRFSAMMILGFLSFFIGACLGGAIAASIIRKRTLPAEEKVEIENASRREAAERENARRMEAAEQKYESDCAKYELECKCLEQERETSARVQQMITEAIAENQATQMRIKGKLDKLYGLGILYPTFQNTIAVHQIRQYLEMGLCDALEGPTGAYAEYMKDVRAQRICESIQNMRDAVLAALSQIAVNQQLLYREMRQVNANVASLQGSMELGLLAIQGEFQRMREDLIQAESGARASNDAVNRQLEDMHRLLFATAKNQYIAQREQLVNDWWNQRRLERPW